MLTIQLRIFNEKLKHYQIAFTSVFLQIWVLISNNKYVCMMKVLKLWKQKHLYNKKLNDTWIPC